MKTLNEILLAGPDKDAVIAEFVKLVEGHVASRSGLRGIGLRTGLKMLKAAKPGIVERATAKLLPDFLEALDPLHQKFSQTDEKDFPAYLQRHYKTASQALIGAADRRVARANPTVQSYYEKFGKDADEHVRDLLPGLSRIVARYRR